MSMEKHLSKWMQLIDSILLKSKISAIYVQIMNLVWSCQNKLNHDVYVYRT